MSVYARPHPGPRTEIPTPNRDRGEGAHRHVAGQFLNPHCHHRFGVIGCETHDNPAHRMAQNAANDSPSPVRLRLWLRRDRVEAKRRRRGEGRGEGGCHPCILEVMAAPEESCFTPCYPLKTSKSQIYSIPQNPCSSAYSRVKLRHSATRLYAVFIHPSQYCHGGRVRGYIPA